MVNRLMEMVICLVLCAGFAWAQGFTCPQETQGVIANPFSQPAQINPVWRRNSTNPSYVGVLVTDTSVNKNGQNTLAYSWDDGKTFTSHPLPLATTSGRTYQASSLGDFAIDKQQIAHFVSAFLNRDFSGALVYNSASLAAPPSFAEGIEIDRSPAGGPIFEFPRIAVGATFFGVTYQKVTGTTSELVASRSLDAGKTWSVPSRVFSFKNVYTYDLTYSPNRVSILATVPDATINGLLDLWGTSSSDGLHWANPVKVWSFKEPSIPISYPVNFSARLAQDPGLFLFAIALGYQPSPTEEAILTLFCNSLFKCTKPVEVRDTHVGYGFDPTVTAIGDGGFYYSWKDTRNHTGSQVNEWDEYGAYTLDRTNFSHNKHVAGPYMVGPTSVTSLYQLTDGWGGSAWPVWTSDTANSSGQATGRVYYTKVSSPLHEIAFTLNAPLKVSHGAQLDYEFTFTGPAGKKSTLSDAIPSGTTFSSFKAGLGVTCSESTGKLTCTTTTKFSGTSSLALGVKVTAAAGTKITNTASLQQVEGCGAATLVNNKSTVTTVQ